MSSSNSPAVSGSEPVPVVENSDDAGAARGEFSALLSGCAISDGGLREKFGVTGKDRVRWLNGMVSNNIRDLQPGHGVYAFVLNPQGQIQGDLYAYQRGESMVLDVACSQIEKLLPLLKRYIIMDDVKLTEASDQLTSLSLMGPKSGEVMRSAGIDVPALEPMQFAESNSPTGTVTVLRHGHPAIDSFELWLAPGNVPAIRADLLQAGAREAGSKTLDLLRIASGVPEYGRDIRERDLPQETAQDRALNFTKGCYIGQEIVERIRARGGVHRKFSGFRVEGELPAPGTKIRSEGKDVGEITSSASLPVGESELLLALGYIRKEALAPGKRLEAGEAVLQASDLPFPEVFSR